MCPKVRFRNRPDELGFARGRRGQGSFGDDSALFFGEGGRRIIGLLSVSIKNKGKQRDVTRTVTKFMDENFIWKNPHAVQKVGMSTMDYVVGGMDHDFKLRLYRLLRVLDDSSELAMLLTACQYGVQRIP
jgi:hypothetical protein